MSFIQKCGRCDGKGKIDIGNMFKYVPKTCPACGGTGEFEFKTKKENYSTCKRCDGKGKIDIGNMFKYVPRTCPECKGTTLLPRIKVE